jgi:hypothetical protein
MAGVFSGVFMILASLDPGCLGYVYCKNRSRYSNRLLAMQPAPGYEKRSRAFFASVRAVLLAG